jgi:signal-transduction protein with cAMP-binding, CBS, and nucleotidyltransferase domain
MRLIDAGTVLVADETERLIGIVTDRDIAIRAVAEGLDPLSTTVGDISSPYPTTVSPGTSVRDAVKLMREHDVRRLPVIEGERPVGVVSLGDLAILQDPSSVLADISAAPSTDRSVRGTRVDLETPDLLDAGVPTSVLPMEEMDLGGEPAATTPLRRGTRSVRR